MSVQPYTLYISTAAAVVSIIAAVMTIRKAKRELNKMDGEAYAAKIMSIVRASKLPIELVRIARQEFDMKLRDKLQIEFSTMVTKNEFNTYAREQDRRLVVLEKCMSELIGLTNKVDGKIDTLLEMKK